MVRRRAIFHEPEHLTPTCEETRGKLMAIIVQERFGRLIHEDTMLGERYGFIL